MIYSLYHSYRFIIPMYLQHLLVILFALILAEEAQNEQKCYLFNVNRISRVSVNKSWNRQHFDFISRFIIMIPTTGNAMSFSHGVVSGCVRCLQKFSQRVLRGAFEVLRLSPLLDCRIPCLAVVSIPFVRSFVPSPSLSQFSACHFQWGPPLSSFGRRFVFIFSMSP